MNILITGVAGFIGSHLLDFLLEKGHEVKGIDDLSTGTLKNIESHLSNKRFIFTQGNICSEKTLESLVASSDLIFHLAAAVGVKLIVEKPVHTIETNIMGTHILLRLAQKYNKKVMIASTSEVYGKNQNLPFKETHDMVLGPTTKHRWSYACSKAIDEFLALAYFTESKLPVVIVRFFNTIGPRQTGRYGMVVPRFIKQAIHEEPITVYGSGEQTRCFGYVKEAVQAIYELSERDIAVGRVFNIGSTQRVTINNLALMVKDMTQSASEIVHIPYEEAYESGFEDMHDRMPDVSSLKSIVGWSPTKPLKEILKEMINFENGSYATFLS
ncbi:MAG TPA: GDP-mannose 4,6-dehydratase [Bdellovibrionota bacterium]|nr:GDP-mannose 4,6-dehydratase [Bdellovibrionota bacterium]